MAQYGTIDGGGGDSGDGDGGGGGGGATRLAFCLITCHFKGLQPLNSGGRVITPPGIARPPPTTKFISTPFNHLLSWSVSSKPNLKTSTDSTPYRVKPCLGYQACM